jgi:hypothetical protein
MQPKAIQRFDMLYLGSLAVSAAAFFIGYDESLRQLNQSMAGTGMELGGGFLAGIFVFGMAISLLLWWLISSKHSVVAKWILAVLTVLSVLGVVLGLQQMLANFTITVGLQLLATVMGIASIYFLFTADAKPWFEREETR